MIDFYKFVFARIERKYKVFFVFLTLLLFVLPVTQILVPIIQKKTIDVVMNGDTFENEIILICIVSFIGIAIELLAVCIQNSILFYLERKLQFEMIISALLQKNKIIKERGAGAYMVSLFGDTEHIARIIYNNSFATAIQVMATIFMLFYSLKWSTFFAPLIVFSYLLLLASNFFCGRYHSSRFSQGREKVMEINPKVLELIENRITVLGYGNANERIENLREDFETRDGYFKTASVIEELSVLFNSAIKTISMVLFFIISMIQINNSLMSLSSFVALLTCFSYVFLPVNSIKAIIMGIEKYKIMKSKIEAGLLRSANNYLPRDNSLVMSSCSFGYNKDELTVKDITIDFSEKVGIVGLSGKGKSTIVGILYGENIPISGCCTCGMVDTDKIHKNIIYSIIRYYKQDSDFFDEDLLYNITLGKEGVSYEEYRLIVKNTFEELNKFVKSQGKEGEANVIFELFFVGGCEYYKKGNIENVYRELIDLSQEQILMLAEVYASKCYYVREKYIALIRDLNIEGLGNRRIGRRGERISGGEKNRVALARFLLPEYGKYYVIDEPFTSLDVINEKECFEVLIKYTKNMTGVLISHKMNIISQCCNKIYVVDNNTICGFGTHEYLLKTNDLYRKLNNNEKIKLL
ncbi:ATP-binding cassette domain-containing protein [Acetivibrio ethanolgignens]|uniref:ABC transporter ATP-binding protein n=1 Tax=Acetivibrio ethanolgignens TaxID=290052 RepID=A0A0V8QHE9_9FIRM|nr:ABC transporter ATP-binding protein [Acetivibrio ethanolgignens]KSV60005.1 hypothetical protein ASU35_06930 [Acetivibrio ethanolgignens]